MLTDMDENNGFKYFLLNCIKMVAEMTKLTVSHYRLTICRIDYFYSAVSHIFDKLLIVSVGDYFEAFAYITDTSGSNIKML